MRAKMKAPWCETAGVKEHNVQEAARSTLRRCATQFILGATGTGASGAREVGTLSEAANSRCYLAAPATYLVAL
jgi:hypothetical protein